MKSPLPLGLIALGVACAPVDKPAARAQRADRQCFNVRNVNGFHAIDQNTVLVTVGANQVYSLDIVGVCPDIDWTQRIAIRSTGGGSWVCRGLDAELLVPEPVGRLQTCPVTGVRKLSDAEVRAWRESRR